MTKRNSAFILCSCLLAAIMISCTQQRDPCLQPRVMSLRMGAYRIADTTTVDTSLLAPVVAAIDFDDSVKTTVYGTKNQAKFSIYLSPQADSCRWMILPDTSASINTADTLTFYYDKSLQFLSNACGYSYFYNLHSVRTTNHSIDSVVISTYNVNSDASKEHLKIYY